MNLCSLKDETITQQREREGQSERQRQREQQTGKEGERTAQ